MVFRRTSFESDYEFMEGPIEGKCPECGHHVVIGPKAYEVLMRGRGANRIVCAYCMIVEFLKMDPRERREARFTSNASPSWFRSFVHDMVEHPEFLIELMIENEHV
jgi:hypothetical protein